MNIPLTDMRWILMGSAGMSELEDKKSDKLLELEFEGKDFKDYGDYDNY